MTHNGPHLPHQYATIISYAATGGGNPYYWASFRNPDTPVPPRSAESAYRIPGQKLTEAEKLANAELEAAYKAQKMAIAAELRARARDAAAAAEELAAAATAAGIPTVGRAVAAAKMRDAEMRAAVVGAGFLPAKGKAVTRSKKRPSDFSDLDSAMQHVEAQRLLRLRADEALLRVDEALHRVDEKRLRV